MNKRGKLIIIGNGFDLAHNIPTSYNDFRFYLIANYPNSYINKDRIISLDEVDDIKSIAVEVMFYAIDHANGEEWFNFEFSLSQINFQEKFPRHFHREDPKDDNRAALNYLMYISALTNIFNDCVEMWGTLLSDWIKEIEKSIETKI